MMLRDPYSRLTKDGIHTMRESEGSNEVFMVQVYELKVGRSNKVSCLLSDGCCVSKAIFVEDGPINGQNIAQCQYAIICIKNHTVSETSKRIGVVEMDLVCEYDSLIGDPVEEGRNPNEGLKIDPKGIRGKRSGAYFVDEENNKRIPSVSHVSSSIVMARTPQYRSSGKVSKLESLTAATARGESRRQSGGTEEIGSYETIRDLYVGLRGWHLLCRVIDISENTFKKKGTAEPLLVLRVTLMDRSSLKITGTFFGEVADKFRDTLKKNAVYKISEGTIQSEEYSATRNKSNSPFRIAFNLQSTFDQVSDVCLVAHAESNVPSIGEVLERGCYEQEQDAVGILVEIDEPVVGTNGTTGASFSRCNCLIADPIKCILVSVVSWNSVKADSTLLGKTVVLSRFILKDYKGSPLMDGRNQSAFLAVHSHPFQSLEYSTMLGYRTYERLSDQAKDSGEYCLTTREMGLRIEGMGEKDTIKSELRVWMNRVSMKKWYFDGCMHCKKMAQARATCMHCEKYNEKTVPHFIMPIELSDASGSFWTTAYDEFAKRIFQDEENVIDRLSKLDMEQLKDIMENYCFQQYRVLVYSKKDKEGRIKHNVGKVLPDSPLQAAISNLEKIRVLLAS